MTLPISDSPGHRIGAAARLSGVSAANIRFYEKERLLTAHGRSLNSYRFYSNDDVHRLRFIRLCRAMDMSLDEVRSLLGLDLRRKADCRAASEALTEHLGHVRSRMAELRRLEKDLVALRDRCDGHAAHCRTIEELHRRADEQVVPAAARSARTKRHV